MKKAWLGILLVACGVYTIGCGGGSGGGSKNVNVMIESNRFFPKNVSIAAGNRVTWVNTDSQPHQVVSGTLQPQGNPAIIHTITIASTGFTPAFLQTNLGDTIRFNNLSGSTFSMDIVDDNGNLVSRLVLSQGELRTFTFPGAGLFTFRQTGTQSPFGQIKLFGQPTPDGLFESPVLNNGDTFVRQFNSPGTFNYFDLNQNNPNQSFMTGTVTVQ